MPVAVCAIPGGRARLALDSTHIAEDIVPCVEPPWQLCTGIKGKAIIAKANKDKETLVVYTDG
jgi:hypothetical protein